MERTHKGTTSPCTRELALCFFPRTHGCKDARDGSWCPHDRMGWSSSSLAWWQTQAARAMRDAQEHESADLTRTAPARISRSLGAGSES
eukprot:9504001-Pyramimonas_sp.AAC.1